MAHVWEPWLQCQSVILKYLYLAYRKHSDQHYLRMPAKKEEIKHAIRSWSEPPTPIIQTQARWFFRTLICHFLNMLVFQVKVAQSCLESLQPHWLYSPLNSPGQNTGIGNLSLFQEIFPRIKPRSKVIIPYPNNWSLNLLTCHAVSSMSLDLITE